VKEPSDARGAELSIAILQSIQRRMNVRQAFGGAFSVALGVIFEQVTDVSI
jgi:hypothetical protein